MAQQKAKQQKTTAGPTTSPNVSSNSISIANSTYNSTIRNLKIISSVSIAIAIIAIIIAAYALETRTTIVYNQSKSNQTVFGQTLQGIDTPLNASALAVINDAPNSYFEIAGERYLNKTLTDEIIPAGASPNLTYSPFIVNGKPSVIYVGALSCIYCGENRWAMALALSRFGSFSKLFVGYSSFGDGDLPTLYWNDYNYTITSGVAFGNYYSSNSINFISAEYESPVTQGFEVQPLPYFISLSDNSTYTKALEFMNGTNEFLGTPFTFWGTQIDPGADAVVFGNSTPETSVLPLTYMTHAQVLSQLENFNDQFSWGEYAAADVYVAQMCASVNNSAPVCSLSAIKQIQAAEGY